MIWGGHCRLPTDMRPSCQITLKRKPEQRSLSQCVGLSLLQHVSPYVHRSRGHDLIRLSRAVFVLLSLLCSLCLSCSLCFITASAPLLLCYPTFLLCSITGLSSPMKTPPVLDNFEVGTLTLKML